MYFQFRYSKLWQQVTSWMGANLTRLNVIQSDSKGVSKTSAGDQAYLVKQLLP